MLETLLVLDQVPPVEMLELTLAAGEVVLRAGRQEQAVAVVLASLSCAIPQSII
jgi:hypothetical protein